MVKYFPIISSLPLPFVCSATREEFGDSFSYTLYSHHWRRGRRIQTSALAFLRLRGVLNLDVATFFLMVKFQAKVMPGVFIVNICVSLK